MNTRGSSYVADLAFNKVAIKPDKLKVFNDLDISLGKEIVQ